VRRRWIVLAIALASVGAAASAFFRSIRPAREAPGCVECRSRPAVPPPAPVSDDGFEKPGAPRPGDWLAVVREPGQTFEEYIAACANRRCPHRTTIYLQPLEVPPNRRSYVVGADERHARALETLREYAEAFFGVPARLLDPIPMFEDVFDADRSQSDASAILDRLAERMPPDALVCAGITADDLYTKGLNFVFGLGSLASRTGVYSLRRYQTQDDARFARRALKLMSHELGHILSIQHCTAYRCVMQGANSLQEEDGQPVHLCPIDLRKLEWNTGFDRADRYRRLGAFYRRLGLDADADWVEARLRP
jgi:archaemetzincin